MLTCHTHCVFNFVIFANRWLYKYQVPNEAIMSTTCLNCLPFSLIFKRIIFYQYQNNSNNHVNNIINSIDINSIRKTKIFLPKIQCTFIVQQKSMEDCICTYNQRFRFSMLQVLLVLNSNYVPKVPWLYLIKVYSLHI